MSSEVTARTPGAKRAAEGEYLFDLATVNQILGGPDYSTANGACVEGDRMIVGLMRMPAGTGAEPHSHPNEQWIYVLEGVFRAEMDGKVIDVKAGLRPLHSGRHDPCRESDARGRRGLLHLQGRVLRPARNQGGLIRLRSFPRQRESSAWALEPRLRGDERIGST